MSEHNSAAWMLRFTLAVACFLAALAALSGLMGVGTTLSLYLASAWFAFTAMALLIWPKLSLRGYQIISIAVLSLLILRWGYSWLLAPPEQVIIGLSTGLLYTPLFMTITTILMSGRGKTICISVGVIMGLLVSLGGSRPELTTSYLGDWRLGPLIAAVYGVFGWLLTNWVAERKALSIRTNETEALAKKANTDPLTGINNRRAADSWMKEREDSARRCGVIFIDIDHFKRINDSLGHDVGDKVLVEVAQLMKDNIRNDDFIARWGGEEFVVLLSSVSVEETSGIAEKLRRNIEKLSKPELPSITASFGVSHAPRGEDLSEAIKRADVGLYRAKNRGRNRVEVEPTA